MYMYERMQKRFKDMQDKILVVFRFAIVCFIITAMFSLYGYTLWAMFQIGGK